ncbi:class I SAM-dependent methyltransferase [Solidesulfovibrio alcoholivorans]|uniref:class I SAM-dependent methyltransferase n=1 Tax=Solidesulfovibrio alcoholivorans TaxID=81406 RepID=UPI000A0231E2|nr:class I SAM-dependent methyltransferase [Solidesulfovibrio alcoholivorans]
MDLKEIDILEDSVSTHWYYCSKLSFINSLLPNKVFNSILDIGAGSGLFSKNLLETTEAKKATCYDLYYSHEADEIHAGKHIFYRKNITEKDYNCDLILLIDIIEHIENDKEFLTTISLNAKKGTIFLICVPAFQWLWGPHDTFLEHKRRYTLTSLEGLLESVQLKTIRTTYCYGFLFPIAAIHRLLLRIRQWASPTRQSRSDLRTLTPLINNCFFQINKLESIMLQYLNNKVAGLSVFAVAQKV